VPVPSFTTCPSGPDWLFGLKYDGFRALAYVEAGTVRLVSRRDNADKPFSDPVRVESARVLPVGEALLKL